VEEIKNPITIIKQDSMSKKIVSVKSISPESFFSESESSNENLIDCDLDSILSIGNYEVTALKKIQSADSFTFTDLLPVVTVDSDGKVLMQAFLNSHSLSETFGTKFANYFSRSRNKNWLKGESSDNKQEILEVYFSEKDSFFVYVVKQKMAACHEGFYSCFYRKINSDKSLIQIDFDRKFKPEKVYG
jgi:phosphoribosyl-AMP cyclohydrolase